MNSSEGTKRRHGSAPARSQPGARPSAGPLRNVSLDDRYGAESGQVLLTGVQALVRVIFDQRRRDQRDGMRTAAFASGYPGSPLGGFDRELAGQRERMENYDVVHRPALNEELGATAVYGSQLVSGQPAGRYDGVVGVWYVKSPGLERSGDAVRHANYAGVARSGGVLALIGDDPSCKSSTVPSASEEILAGLHVPTLYPGTIQECLDLGLHGVALSRASGLWVAMKIVTSIADGVGTADVALDRVVTRSPSQDEHPGWEGHQPQGMLLAPRSLELEKSVFETRLPAAVEYARVNGLNEVVLTRPGDWLGIAAAGRTYYEVVQALADLGLDFDSLRQAGVRLAKVAMPYPADREFFRRFASGLQEVLVVEEKTGLIERSVKDALLGMARAPRIVGREDEGGARLVPPHGELTADIITPIVAGRLRDRLRLDSIESRVAAADRKPSETALPVAARPPFFCSGCPHNRSTVTPDGTLVGVGIGCHTMIMLAPEGRGELTGITAMGGEGAQWLGMAPFTDAAHFVQNLGDGTFYHSGSLAVRAAIAAEANVTFKILYNDHIAMTGGQAVPGAGGVPDLTRLLESEGVKQTIITTDEPGGYRHVDLASNATVRPRGELLAVQNELAALAGVTVLIHDGECAAELRRARKRGKAVDPPTRVVINERVCEGCGDCGRKSNCLSVIPVDTEFGRKTEIHQSSCNKDYSCLEGDCPAFMTVLPEIEPDARAPAPTPPDALPEPRLRVPADDFRVRMVGVGGTGVVTINQVLGMAALLEGRHAWGLDQTGLSQKGGPVVSDMRLTSEPTPGSNEAPAGTADLYLCFDLLGGLDAANLAKADPDRTIAVVSTSSVATGAMVTDPNVEAPPSDRMREVIQHSTRHADNVYVDAQGLSERLFGEHVFANVITLGAAYQAGALPVGLQALEQALGLNAVAVENNLAALAWGRACVATPDAVSALEAAEEQDTEPRTLSPEFVDRIERISVAVELRRLLEVRTSDLVDYQAQFWADDYLQFVERVRGLEEVKTPGCEEATVAVARYLYKLMAYKDEYEVARLQVDAHERSKVVNQFGADAKVYLHLHPPALRALGLRRKLRFGRWFLPVLGLLRRLRRLRGTPFDPFGMARVRRVERSLIAEYRELVEEGLEHLNEDSQELVLELLALPDLVRGYEQIKLDNVDRFRKQAARLLAELRSKEPMSASQEPESEPPALG